MAANARVSDADANAQIVLELVGGILICSALAWAAGQLAGLLFSWSWLDVSLAHSPLLAFRWIRNWRDPALAWPADLRPMLAGPLGMYFSLGLVAAPPLGLVYGIKLRWRRPRTRRSSETARWASRWRLRHLAVRRATGWLATVRVACSHWLPAQTEGGVTGIPVPTAALLIPLIALSSLMRFTSAGGRALGLVKVSPASRIGLGRRWHGLRRPLLAAEECASVICFGPPGSFKTAGLAIPAILEWFGPLVATSIKPDVIRATWGHRASGQVWIYNPLRAGDLPSSSWTPLSACTTWTGAKEMGAWLAAAADVTGQSRDDQNYWTTLGAKLLSALLFAAAGTGRSIADVVHWIDIQEIHEVDDALSELGEPSAQDAWDACKAREDRTRSSVYGTAETLLDVYSDPRVQASAHADDIDIDLLLSGDNSLFLYAPAHQQRRLRPLFVALVTAIVRRAQERAATAPGGMLRPRLLLCLDEAGNIAAIPDLPELVTTGRGQGIALLTIFHDLGQVQARYGRQANTVVNGHRAKLFLSGQADTASLELSGKLTGDEAVTESSVSLRSPFAIDEFGSRTIAERLRPLVPADQVRQLPVRQGLLIYGHLPPVKVRLRAWWRSPGLRRRAYGRLRAP